MENMEVVGEDVKTSFVQTLEECASKCSQTDLCDSFWVFTAKVNICHMKREGEFNLNPRKSAGRCTKGLLLKPPTIQIGVERNRKANTPAISLNYSKMTDSLLFH